MGRGSAVSADNYLCNSDIVEIWDLVSFLIPVLWTMAEHFRQRQLALIENLFKCNTDCGSQWINMGFCRTFYGVWVREVNFSFSLFSLSEQQHWEKVERRQRQTTAFGKKRHLLFFKVFLKVHLHISVWGISSFQRASVNHHCHPLGVTCDGGGSVLDRHKANSCFDILYSLYYCYY